MSSDRSDHSKGTSDCHEPPTEFLAKDFPTSIPVPSTKLPSIFKQPRLHSSHRTIPVASGYGYEPRDRLQTQYKPQSGLLNHRNSGPNFSMADPSHVDLLVSGSHLSVPLRDVSDLRQTEKFPSSATLLDLRPFILTSRTVPISNGLLNTSSFPPTLDSAHTSSMNAQLHLPKQDPKENTFGTRSQVYLLPPVALPQSSYDTAYPREDHFSKPNFPLMVASVSSNSYKHETQNVNSVIMKYLPLLQEFNLANFGKILVALLRECPHDFPLDTFYNLLYDPDSFGSLLSLVTQGTELQNSSPRNPRSSDYESFRLLLEIAMNPDILSSGLGSGFKKVLPRSINYHELLRTFLAIKIIFDCVKEGSFAASNRTVLPRLSIFKVYYIICQRLLIKNLSSPNSSNLDQNLLLGQSTIGKLTKIIYPHAIAKRLGKRGFSKFHYIGLKWDKSIVDESVLCLVELDMPALRTHLKDYSSPNEQEKEFSHYPPSSLLNVPSSSGCAYYPQSLHVRLSTEEPSRSHLDGSGISPGASSSPQVQGTSKSPIPLQQKWSRDMMQKSMEALKVRNVDLLVLQKDFSSRKLSEVDGETILIAVLRVTNHLLNSSPSETDFLHLSLIVSHLILPMIVSSDLEMNPNKKMQLQAALNEHIASLESDRQKTSSINEGTLCKFTGLLKKMVKLSKVTLFVVKSEFTVRAWKLMVREVEILATRQDYLQDRLALEDIFVRSTIMGVNAYRFNICDKGSKTYYKDTVRAISRIAKVFLSAVVWVKDSLNLELATVENGAQSLTHDLPHKIFKYLMEALHEICLMDPVVSKLPIPILSFNVLHVTNEVQKLSFHNFKKRDPLLSREIFKTWWVFSTTFQEYLSVLSEISALNQRLHPSE